MNREKQERKKKMQAATSLKLFVAAKQGKKPT